MLILRIMDFKTEFKFRINKNEKLRYNICYALREGAGNIRENFMKKNIITLPAPDWKYNVRNICHNI